ncbi:9061_t:CDS:2, partial [Racocetra persica]
RRDPRLRDAEELGWTIITRNGEDYGHAKSKTRDVDERGRAKSRTRDVDERGRAKSKTREVDERGRAKSRTREAEERERAKSRTREVEERERAKSRTREVEERERAKSRTREVEGRERTKSRTREAEERGRAKSRTRETDERGRAKSRTRETDEHGRAKSRTREQEDRERAEKATRDKEYEILLMEKEKHTLRREKTKHETHHEKDDTHTSEVMIHIEELRQYREMSLTSNTTALDVLTYFRSDGTISDADAWTLFEVITDLGLERPLRDWEFVTKVTGSWELDKDNSLVLKKYAYRSPLTLQGFKNTMPIMVGFLHLEIKKNKWQKRYFQIKDGSIYHSKDLKGTNETFLCSMVSFDVYTCTHMTKRYQTKFAFALKSQDRITMFLNPENDYIRFLCADDLDTMNNWILNIRMARNHVMRRERPELFVGIPSKIEKVPSPINLDMPLTNALPAAVSETTSLMSEITFELATLGGPDLKQKPLASAQVTTVTQDTTGTTAQNTTQSTTNQLDTLRRHARSSSGKFVDFASSRPSITPQLNTKELKKTEPFSTSNPLSPSVDESRKNQSSGPFKGGSLLDYDEKNPPMKPAEVETVTFAKGSLLATSEALFEQAKEREKARRGGTIKDLNGNNTIKFQKGSLLSIRFHKGSLLAKSKEYHDNHGTNDR